MAKPAPVLVPTFPDFPLDEPLRQDLQSALVRGRAVSLISKALNIECKNAGWQDAVKARVMQMLKSGDFENRQQLVQAIVKEARGLPAEDEGGEDGLLSVKGEGKGRERGTGYGNKGVERGEKAVDIRIPEKATVEATRVVRETLDKVVEIEPEKDFWSS
jgi:hypothetical protein